MKHRQFLLCILAALALLVSLCGCGNQNDAKKEQQIIKNLIDTFDAKSANPETEQLLSELETANPEKAKVWKSICSTWYAAYQDGFVHDDILPDNLPEDNSLAIVVLGFELNPDGTMKDELIGRLSTAYDCALRYPNAYVVMTGGGTASENKSVTEADSMADWMRAKGIAEERILVENKSMTTLENASNTCAILAEKYPTVTKLAIVTSGYHVPWGTVDFHAVIQYEASRKGTAPVYEIISNAGYRIENTVYTYDVINQYQKSQLWDLASQF